ncbi:MAG TPA: deoxyhypusine synthase [Candidatus Marinimicrobia bacterium]|nr:deoxyhypusine synthase [Candidatus Neomarinimicrobiota bacterium]HQE96327.1 deoxyhypusine synthase [Candidatus Neomarinimicrobiota bacterium]HQK12251.1 deoxyhypusine synthase [Candidatus Neomarinimicrobiota bacterium]
MKKNDYLQKVVEHIDIKSFDARPILKAYSKMAFQARNLAVAADIYDRMLKDEKCKVILTLAGSLFSAGLKNVVADMVENNMVDAIVSTGALIVDQDFFEALGYKHYIGTPFSNDNELRDLAIDRIYDTYIDEDELRVCDLTIAEIANSLPPRPFSSREFIEEMGKYLDKVGIKTEKSVVYSAYKKGVPIFVPAFSDCSAGFGLIHHQWNRKGNMVTIDSARDFLELTKIKIAAKETGILMIGGGVPKNFTQDVVVATDVLGIEKPMHKYAVQLTVADERDGGLSGSTLKEASSWGKVDTKYEQMVFGEATVMMPLLVSYAYHQGNWKKRQEARFSNLFV